MLIRSLPKSFKQAKINLSHEELFENRTNLFEITLKNNFSSFAKDRGFGFASFISSSLSADIFVPHKVTERILKTATSLPSSLWAEVSCKKEGATNKYRIEFIWLQLDDVIADTRKSHIKQAAISIKQFQDLKQFYFDEKSNIDKSTRDKQLIFTYDEFLSSQNNNSSNRD